MGLYSLRHSNRSVKLGAILFLLSDLASYVNGALIMADGGLSAGFFTRGNGRDFSSKALLAQGVYSE